MQEILEIMMSEIGYGNATLPECCKRIGERQGEPFKSGFVRIYETMRAQGGESFSTVFCSVMGETLKELPVTEEDKTVFLSFATGQSFEDGAMQLRTIERSKEVLKKIATGLEAENAEKSRLAVGLGAMSGLLLVIVLL